MNLSIFSKQNEITARCNSNYIYLLLYNSTGDVSIKNDKKNNIFTACNTNRELVHICILQNEKIITFPKLDTCMCVSILNY